MSWLNGSPSLPLTYICFISSALQDYESQAEEATQAIERFVNGTSRTSAPPSAVLPVPDYPNMFWSSINGQQRQDEKLALIREIVNALPELDMIRHLHQVFVSRCQGPLGNVVHTPTFLKQAEKFNECFNFHSLNAQVTALSSRFSMDMLACHLLAVRTASYRDRAYAHNRVWIAYTRPCLSSHLISTLLVPYTSSSSCARASSIIYTLYDMEVARLALPSRRGVILLWLDCKFASRHNASA